MIQVAIAFTIAIGVLALTTIPDDVLVTVNSLEILGIIYLAIAVSKLRERIGKMEGKIEGQGEARRGRSDS